MANSVLLPAPHLTLSAIAPTIDVSDDNTVRLPAAHLSTSLPEPTINAGQQKLRYSGVRMGVITRLGAIIG
jgi:hypothetical protein